MKKKSILIISLLVGLVSTLILSVAYSNADTVIADDLFSANDIDITTNYQIDPNLVDDDRKGVLLTSNTSGSYVDFSSIMSGTFELDFRVFSERTFQPTGKAHGSVISNNALELNTLTFTFINEENGDKFDVIIDGSCEMNFATPQASVLINGRRVGVYQYPYSNVGMTDEGYTISNTSGNTTGANSKGRYTALIGTSFSNTAYSKLARDQVNGVIPIYSLTEKISEKVNSNIIGFNPINMQVYSKDDNGNVTVIWDMSTGNLDGQLSDTLDSFNKYKVRIAFTDIANGKNAKLVIYSLNGQSFSGNKIEDCIGPNSFVVYNENTVKDNKFFISKPITFDVLGKETKEIYLSATLNNLPINVYNASGDVTDKYKDGCYVIPNKAGEMIISYTANDGSFNGNTFSSVIRVFQFEPDAEFEFDEEIESGNYGKGTVLRIPQARVYSPLFNNVRFAKAKIYKEGILLCDVEKDTSYEFSEIGNYAIEYFVDGVSNVRKVFTVNISDDIPSFEFEYFPKEQAKVGSIYNAPDCNIVFKNETFEAEFEAVYPNGDVYSNKDFSLNIPGKYLLKYFTNALGGETKKEVLLTVFGEQVTFDYNANVSSVEYEARNPRYYEQVGCLLKSNTTTAEFTYSQNINISKASKEDKLIEIYAAGEWGNGSGYPTVKITDVNDEENYLTVSVVWGWHTYLQYVRACAPGQKMMSIDAGGTLHDETIGSSGAYGLQVEYVYTEMPAETGFGRCCLSLYYDNEEKAVYLSRGDAKYLIIDFDDEAYQDTLWGGFTGDEVKISISGISAALITEIGGVSMQSAYFSDEKSPVINIDVPQSIPQAVVGKQYKLFDAKSIDDRSGNVDTSVNVYYNYGYVSCAEMGVIDGYFTPKFIGDYTICYTATDGFGNTAQKTLVISAVDISDINNAVWFENESPVETGNVGLSIVLPKITSKSGGFGELEETVFVILPNGEKIVINDYSFMPKTAGIYNIIYEVRDYIGQGAPNSMTKTYSINVTPLEQPVIEEFDLPKAILKDAPLYIPIIKAWDYYTVSVKELNVAVSATLNDKDIDINDNIIVPNEEGVLKVKYTATNENHISSSIVKQIQVVKINPEAGFEAQYFYNTSGEIDVKANHDGIVLKPKTINSAVQFINPVLASGASIRFDVNNCANGDNVKVKLYDYEDMSISVSVTFKYENGNIMACINDGNYSIINSDLGFVYSHSANMISTNSGSILGKVSYCEDGKIFNGFPSKKIWISIESNKNSSNFEIVLKELNLITLNDNRTLGINIKPSGAVVGNIPSIVKIGTTCLIPSVISQDVFSPITNVTVKIGTKSLDLSSDCYYTFDKVGVFNIVYTITDSKAQVGISNSNNSAKKTVRVQVVEDEKPTISYSNNIIGQLSVNEKYNLPQITATDNTEVLSVKVFIIYPNYKMKEITQDYQFVPTEPGEYIIRYLVFDTSYNYIMEDHIINVK